MCMPVHVSNSKFFCENGKITMKCVEYFDASAEGASQFFLNILIDHRNLL